MALAAQGIDSAQAKEDAVTSLQAAEAAVNTARGNLNAAEASLREAKAHELLTSVSQRSVDEARDTEANARALAAEAPRGARLRGDHLAGGWRGECVGGAAGRSGAAGHAHCHHYRLVADLGVRAGAGNRSRRGEAGRQACAW